MVETRKYLTPKRKQALYEEQEGLCAICEKPCPIELMEWDHYCPHALGGSSAEENMRGIHADCHKIKTRSDIKMIAKANRIRKGGNKKRGPKLQSRGFQTKLKRKMTGEVVPR